MSKQKCVNAYEDATGHGRRKDSCGFLGGLWKIDRDTIATLDGPFDLVFIDPPYSSAARLAERLSELLPAVLAEGARIVTEQDKRNPLELELPLEFERDYGDTRIRIHRA